MAAGDFALTDEQKRQVIIALEQRGAILPCSRCGKKDFGLSSGFITNLLGDGQNMVIGGPAIPSIAVICSNCGAMYHHAIGVLGLFDAFGFTKG